MVVKIACTALQVSYTSSMCEQLRVDRNILRIDGLGMARFTPCRSGASRQAAVKDWLGRITYIENTAEMSVLSLFVRHRVRLPGRARWTSFGFRQSVGAWLVLQDDFMGMFNRITRSTYLDMTCLCSRARRAVQGGSLSGTMFCHKALTSSEFGGLPERSFVAN